MRKLPDRRTTTPVQRAAAASFLRSLVLPSVFAITALTAVKGYAEPAPSCYPLGQAVALLKPFHLSPKAFTKGAGNLCDEESDLVKLLRGLEFLANLKFADPIPKFLAAPGMLSTDYAQYLYDNIHKLEYQPHLGCETPTICTVADTSLDGHMRLGSPFFRESVVERATTLVHETRHTMADGYDHVDCVRGTYADASGACDQSFSFYGSYGVEVEMDARIYHSSLNTSAFLRSMAREGAIDGLTNRFNALEMVNTAVDYAVLVGADGQITLFNGDTVSQPALKVQPRSVVMTGTSTGSTADGSITVLPGDRESSAQTLSIHTLNSADADEFSIQVAGGVVSPLDGIYRWLTADNRHAIKDAMVFQEKEVVIYKTTLALLPVQGAGVREVDLSSIANPTLVTYAPFCDEFDKMKARPITIRADDNSIYFVDATTLQLTKSSCRFPKGIKEIVRLNQKRYGLTEQGHLVFVGSPTEMTEVEALRDLRFDTLKKFAGRQFRSFAP